MPSATAHAPNAALLIDFDNVTLGVRSDLTKELRTLLNSDIIKGKVAVQRAYADWRRYPQYIVPLSESSIDLIFAPAHGTNKKNATDIRLAIDAIELVFTRPEIGTFILLSGDSDFSTMVIKLKEYGKYVIGVGLRDSASDLLIQNCDEYYSYSDLAGLSKDDRETTARDPWELVQEAVTRMVAQGDVMRSDRLKQVMQQIDPNFEERNAGYSRFSRFLAEAASRGLLHSTKLENGQYEVSPIEAGGAAAPATTAPSGRAPTSRRTRKPRSRTPRSGAAEEPAPPSRSRTPRSSSSEAPAKKSGRRRSTTSARDGGKLTLAKAFSLLREALQQLDPPVDQEALRVRMVAVHGKEDPLLEAGRFQRLLRQANDAEVVDVRKVGDDDYEVGLTAADAQARVAVQSAAAQVRGAAAVTPEAEVKAAPAAEGPRRGIRHRRGSRVAGAGDAPVPMVGVVTLDAPKSGKQSARTAKKPARKSASKTAKKAASKPRAKSAKKTTKKTAKKKTSTAKRSRKSATKRKPAAKASADS
jgi:uncharacterized LabA/DUF88 family protein